MTREDYLDKLYALSFTAGMNQRYHQSQWSRFARSDKRTRIAVGIIALVGVVGSLLSAAIDNSLLDISSGVIAILSLTVAIILNISPAVERETFHHDLFRRWSDLRENVDTVMVRVENLKDEDITREIILLLEELTAKKNRNNSLENAADEKLLNDCFEAESLARTGHTAQEESPAA